MLILMMTGGLPPLRIARAIRRAAPLLQQSETGSWDEDRRANGVKRQRQADDDGEAEMHGEDAGEDGADHRGAAVDAPGPGH